MTTQSKPRPKKAPVFRRFTKAKREASTERSKLCVEIAEILFQLNVKGGTIGETAEIRQWLKLSAMLEAAAATADVREIEDIKDKLVAKQQRADKLSRLSGGGNVVPLKSG